MVALADLPPELFLDNILPLLPVADLLRFSCTCRYFYQLGSDEAFWHQKIQKDYNFSGSETARSTGWKFLYKRLFHPRVFLWGERSHGRLGGVERAANLKYMRDGIPWPVELHFPGPKPRIVSLVAGGMSFHALDSGGNIHVWGELDGLSIALRSDGFSVPQKQAERPMRLSMPAKFRSISCGRLHCTALDAQSQVWTFISWGRPFRLLSPLLGRSSPETTPIQVASGWSLSAVLTASGDVLVWWPFSGRMHEVIIDKNESLDEHDATSHTKAIPTSREPNVIPCYPWELEGVDPVCLPEIPSGRLPKLEGVDLTDEEQDAETKLIKIAAMNNAILGLTNKGHVLLYESLGGEDSYRQGRWDYLAEFSDVEKVRAHPAFADPPAEGSERLNPPKMMRITHISAQFQTFVAYSTGSSSMVLMGKLSSPSPVHPTILPSLQNRSVISVVLGDYHYGALTSTGELLTWGAYSKGALGLGDPTKLPVGAPGGYESEQRRMAAQLPGRGLGFPPRDVTVSTAVQFDHGEKRKRKRYCFAAAAAGWHMGALVIDLEPDENDDDEPLNMPGAFPSETPTSPVATPYPEVRPYDQVPEFPILPFGRGNPAFRIGLVGRGIHQRGGRGGGRGRGLN